MQLTTSRQKYIVLRPFCVLDQAGNEMTIHSNEVLAAVDQDMWVQGVVGHLRFRALKSIFAAATVLKN